MIDSPSASEKILAKPRNRRSKRKKGGLSVISTNEFLSALSFSGGKRFRSPDGERKREAPISARQGRNWCSKKFALCLVGPVGVEPTVTPTPRVYVTDTPWPVFSLIFNFFQPFETFGTDENSFAGKRFIFFKFNFSRDAEPLEIGIFPYFGGGIIFSA